MNTNQTSPESVSQEPIEWTVESQFANERIDKFITEALEEDISRTLVQQWVKDGHVKVNGKAVKPNYKLSVQDVIALHIPEPQGVELAAENIPLNVVYEDSDVIVINKQRGLVVHPAPGITRAP